MATLTQMLKQLQQRRSGTQTELGRLDEAIAALEKVARTRPGRGVRRRGRKSGRGIPAAVRRKISAAQKTRWARIKRRKQARAKSRAKAKKAKPKAAPKPAQTAAG